MKITRFAQSCILIEPKEKRILVDPGSLQLDDSLLRDYWKDIDILLVTHKHSDHCNAGVIKDITKDPKTKFYTSSEVAKENPELPANIVKAGAVIEEDNIKIEVTNAVHGYIPTMTPEKIIRESIGFIIDDGEKRLYITGDTICFENGYKCDVVCIPVSGYGVVMGPFEAALFAKETGARLVIPVHLDSPKYPVDYDMVKENFEKEGLKYRVLKIKESIEI